MVLARLQVHVLVLAGTDQQDIREHSLNRIVVASCYRCCTNPRFGRPSTRRLELVHAPVVNIREHVSWVHLDKQAATSKAKRPDSGGGTACFPAQPLQRRRVAINPNVWLGRGDRRNSCCVTLAGAGNTSTWWNASPPLAGTWPVDKTFSHVDCAACILTPKMTAVGTHPGITFGLTRSGNVSGMWQLQGASERKPRYIIEDLCWDARSW